MELINQTPVVADLAMSEHEATGLKHGTISAKASFRWGDDGRAELDTQDPLPLFARDTPTDLGLIPADLAPREDHAFEVILLGKARAPGGRAVEHLMVELSVGEVTRRLMVSGDRRWERRMLGLAMGVSAPRPFTEMPLTWDRAHGGSAAIYLDRSAVVDVDHRLNKMGRGFDAQRLAEDMGKSFRLPEGFPIVRYERLVANLEHPDRRALEWEDDPEPYCWATIPRDIGMAMIRAIRFVEATGQAMDAGVVMQHVQHRAHPDWIIDCPPPESRIVMHGLSTAGRVEVALPQLRVIADYELGERGGERELFPKRMLILPDEQRIAITYQRTFHAAVQPRMHRSFRLKLERGWSLPPVPAKMGAVA